MILADRASSEVVRRLASAAARRSYPSHCEPPPPQGRSSFVPRRTTRHQPGGSPIPQSLPRRCRTRCPLRGAQRPSQPWPLQWSRSHRQAARSQPSPLPMQPRRQHAGRPPAVCRVLARSPECTLQPLPRRDEGHHTRVAGVLHHEPRRRPLGAGAVRASSTSRRARPGFAGAGLEPARALPVSPFEPFQLGDRGLVAVREPERVAGSRQDAVASVLGLGLSPRCKLVRNRSNLARDLGKFERIVGLHGCERRSLAPPTVKQFPNRAHSITVMGFRILGDLHQGPGQDVGATRRTCRALLLRVLWGVLLGCRFGRV